MMMTDSAEKYKEFVEVIRAIEALEQSMRKLGARIWPVVTRFGTMQRT